MQIGQNSTAKNDMLSGFFTRRERSRDKTAELAAQHGYLSIWLDRR